MNLLVRFGATLVLLVGLVVGLACARPAWLAFVGVDLRDLPTLERELERDQKLDRLRDESRAKARLKNAILRDLIAGRIRLLPATAQIVAACDLPRIRLVMDSLDIAGRTENERLCRLVMFWTQALLDDSPRDAARVHERLRYQLEEAVRENGVVMLP